jgi:hypothetical protein
MKTAGRKNPNRCATQYAATETMARKARTDLLNQAGCEARKTPAVGRVFFLDFHLYRTYQDLAAFPSIATKGKGNIMLA